MSVRINQYSLQFEKETNFDEVSFIVTSSNKDAFLFIDKWPVWEEGIYRNIIYIFGERLSGKTHLAKIWQKKSYAINVTTEMLIHKTFFDIEHNSFLLEDIDKNLVGEKDLFAFINYIINSKKFLLITSSLSPTKIKIDLKDLKSRISSFFAVEIKKPDEIAIGQILSKYFIDRQIIVSSNVINYLIKRIDRSYQKIAEVVEELDSTSLLQNKKISIPLIKEIFEYK